MKYSIFLLLFFITAGLIVHAQNNYSMSGYVIDAATGEELIGATIYVEEVQDGTATNVYGF